MNVFYHDINLPSHFISLALSMYARESYSGNFVCVCLIHYFF